MKDTVAFEKSVHESLKKLLFQCGCEVSGVKTLGVAVSGGADSVSLLVALNAVLAESVAKQPRLVCVTVDHSMRPDDAGAKDAAFVLALCQSLGVPCVVKKIPNGIVAQAAKERARGTEEAARYLRYKAFEEFAAESGAEFICLAHNKNDALETLLMRFLQGAGAEAAGGIAAVRGIYLRPLLETSRAQIEEYLKAKNISWCTDATNSDNNYLRNRIRNKLVPFLDENFEGWQKAVLQGGEKNAFYSELLEQLTINNSQLTVSRGSEQGQELVQEEIVFEARAFGSLPVALRQKTIYDALKCLGVTERVPYGFVRTLGFWPEQDFKNLSAAGVFAYTKKDKIFIKKTQKQATESGFFDIIERDGIYNFEDFSLEVKGENSARERAVFVCGKNSAQIKMPFPFVVRNRQVGDEVLTVDGKMKSLADVFSDWKIPENERDKIPLLVKENKIAAVFGCVLGFDNWIVH